ncbi:sugar ABC transporter permease [Rarobacter faecitabidus]|uniref:Cellobiose ABC transporter membrane protein n=1 Tax=Rarobacter faecitabidus TaxID=13243 RepID=A0A542ZUC1_RARFA|nr:sugar ABC transporter permease [Rarobacter faecitabidus]TQL63856.1 cellobiose ABC transporter membrane protein [Rarobacter faecitabidus]
MTSATTEGPPPLTTASSDATAEPLTATESAPGAGPRGPGRFNSPAARAWRGRFDVKASPYLYIAPFFILFTVVGLFPLLYTGYVAMHYWDLLPVSPKQGEFVGLANFAQELTQAKFWIAVRNTFSIFLLSSVPQIIVATFIAAVLNANIRARTFWRMSVLIPYVVAPVAVSLIFGQMFADRYGMFNAILEKIGLDPIAWHVDPLASHFAIATMVNFRWTGYNTLILLAAMQAINRDLYEAALIDGAGRLRQFRSVTLPMIRPTMIFVIITSTIGGLQIFDEAVMFDSNNSQTSSGGSSNQFLTMTMYLKDLGWSGTVRNGFGRGSAVAWLLFLLILIVGAVNFLLTRRIASSALPKRRRRDRRLATATQADDSPLVIQPSGSARAQEETR